MKLCGCNVFTGLIAEGILICFCSFDFSCPIFKKDNFIEMLYNCLVLLIAIYLFFVANLVCFDFDTRFYKILNAIDDICERIFYHALHLLDIASKNSPFHGKGHELSWH